MEHNLYINRVEIKGRISGDVVYRVGKEPDSEWVTFAVETILPDTYDAFTQNNGIKTIVPINAFYQPIVDKLKDYGAKSKDTIWLVGTVFCKMGAKGGIKVPYLTVTALEIEIIKSNKKNERLQG